MTHELRLRGESMAGANLERDEECGEAHAAHGSKRVVFSR
jgi:hypothetical protein